MVYREGISSAITRYFLFNGIFREGEEMQIFESVDANLVEVGEALEREFTGSARKFIVDLDSFDEETHYSEIIVGFTSWPYEDSESEIVLIVKTIQSELERVGFIEDDNYFIGDGPDIR